ncbi:MAG: integration host factor subunit beta [Sphingobacteriia bacterium]|nr:integration host factor subunit beta [Sphingobacteriia bacterium]NCC37999.1 integration host factor subunit beta [Gammaproteobacteria bacterium]
MTKSELIDVLAAAQDHLAYKDVEEAVRKLLDRMSTALAAGERIEIRGFGSFSLHYRPARIGRNPKTGDAVALAGKHVPHFRPGKELRDRVNQAFLDECLAAGQEEQQPPERMAASG